MTSKGEINMKLEDMTPEEQAAAKRFAAAIMQPPEHYNEIINSGMCNSIVKGYILLALDELGLTDQQDRADLSRTIEHLFDNYSAEQARQREAQL